MDLTELSNSLEITHKILLITGAVITISSPFIVKLCKKYHKKYLNWKKEKEERHNLVLSRLENLDKTILEIFHLTSENKEYNKLNEKNVHDIILRIDRMEARLATHGDAMIDPIFRCDLNGNNTYVNRAYCKLLGVSKDRLLGMGWQTFIRPENLKIYNDIWKNSFHNAIEILNLPLIFTKEDGTDINVLMNIRPVRNGKIHEFFGNIELINEITCHNAKVGTDVIECPITGMKKKI